MAEHHEETGGHHHYHPHPQPRYYYGFYGPHYGQTAGVVSDGDIESDVRSALRWDSYVDAGKVDVSVRNGKVTLAGIVDSPLAKRAAGDDAWDTPGVADVENYLEVARSI
jgi:osmotically-inducible protein OsmY